MVAREALQVADPFAATREAPHAPAHVVAGQRRHPAERVESQAVVAPAPARPNLVRSLEDKAAHPSGLERGRGREARGAGAAHDRVKVLSDLHPVAVDYT